MPVKDFRSSRVLPPVKTYQSVSGLRPMSSDSIAFRVHVSVGSEENDKWLKKRRNREREKKDLEEDPALSG